MIEATVFPDVEAALIAALQRGKTGTTGGAKVSNTTPSPITGKWVTVGYSGGGSRDFFEATANAGINVYAQTDSDCRALVRMVQDDLTAASNDLIEGVQCPAGGGTVIPGQQPPYQRYFVATATVRAQSLL